MDCPDCGAATVRFPVEPALREPLPGDEPGVAICRRCLRLHPDDDPPGTVPDLSETWSAFPSNTDAAVPMALVIGLCSSLALYREEIATLLDRVERAGTDPLLVIDRLADDPTVESAVDLRRRRRQLEQLL
ncbi:MAG: DUF6276 family protein [Haloarculaceae archaeon]